MSESMFLVCSCPTLASPPPRHLDHRPTTTALLVPQSATGSAVAPQPPLCHRSSPALEHSNHNQILSADLKAKALAGSLYK
ncbi:hypothetical protein XELAEV_18047783mg [Xenopus laevis]|uniref:Uncharacterized protein n=1 Tax=Xenopus laevis TaxID=8355 RepID=A0A974BVF2_XENLA|nr:hypothetical protein XELAEV_18047783mg [Xenopus laevis]